MAALAPRAADPRPRSVAVGAADLDPASARTLPSAATIGLALLSFAYFNTLFTYTSRAPTPWVRLEPSFAIEVLAATTLLALSCAVGVRLAWLVKVGIALGIFGLALIRYVDIIAPAVMGRDFNTHADLPHVHRVAGMFWEGLPTGAAVLIVLGLAFIAILFVFLNLAGLAALERAFEAPRLRRFAFITLGAAIGVFALAGSGIWAPMQAVFAEPVSAIVAKQWGYVREGRELEATGLPLRAPGRFDSDLGRLAGAHVYLIFLESYGVTLIEDAQHYPYIARRFERFEERLLENGFRFVSTQALSPTFAGGSWRAHATVLSGIRLGNEHFYDALLASDRPTLVSMLADVGYRTVAAEPGIQRQWPEAEYFGFDAIYDAAALGYRGKDIGWWKIPDQYTLYRMYTEEIAPALEAGGPPIFAKISLIMSHIPYFPIPPFVDDWSRFDDQTAFDQALPSIAADDYRSLQELSSRYVAAFEYEIDILEDFLVRFVPDNALVIVSGDHQPPKLVTHDNDSWAVPMHLISRRRDLVEPFERYGFRPGLVPLDQGSFGMEDFLPALLEVLHAGSETDETPLEGP